VSSANVPDLDLPAAKPRASNPGAQGNRTSVARISAAGPASAGKMAAAGPAAAAKAGTAGGAPSASMRAAQPGPMRPRMESRSEAERSNNAFNDPGARTFEKDDDEESVRIELAPAQVAPPPKPAPAPIVKEPTGEEEISPREARALADYGEAPDSPLKTPLYAYRVLRRRKELMKIAAQKKREADRAEAAAEDAMVVFAELVRPTAERYGGSYDLAFEQVRATERVLGERDAVLAQETDAHNQRKAQIDARLSEEEAELTKIQMEERQIAGELAEAEKLLRRAEARAKSAEMEIQSVNADAQGAAPPPPPPTKGP
jgi:hypothetical protein